LSVTEKCLWESVRDLAGPYPPEAFAFVQEGLRYTVDRLAERRGDRPHNNDRHVSGQELCLGLRDVAIDQFGLLARTVLHHWRIERTEDLGRIVFIMVNAGLLRKTDQDSEDDFAAVFDFDEVFGRHLERC
jgi:uncharacterized repeat protein (TIGR04138 family)